MTRAITFAFTSLASVASLGGLLGCNPYDPDLGETPFQCGSTAPVCPEGYFCSPGPTVSVCIKGDEARPDASTQFVCADDGTEPNDMTNRPFVTRIPSGSMSYPLRGLAICPTGDVDNFQFGVTANGTNLEASVVSVRGLTPLQLNLLTGTGAVIATGASDPVTPEVVSLKVENRLASGQYVIQVKSPDMGQNNYDLVIKTCTTPLPCPPI